MMKQFLLVIGLCLAIIAYAQEAYKVSIDLTQVKKDMVQVTIELPAISQDFVEYQMAKTVPGTYEISNFGRFVTDFQAFDSYGDQLTTDLIGLDRNIYRISNATGLSKITYWVQDTFDKFRGYKKHYIFEPEGTSFEQDRDVYLMNTFAMIGYINGFLFNPYEVTIKHPENIYGSTSLKRASATPDTDVFIAENFNFLADAPIMYCEPDTSSREIAGTKITVSVFSPNKLITSLDVMDNIYDLMVAQSQYLGGKLPVDRYAYLIYMMDFNSLSESWGALEHSYSSLYAIPEEEVDDLAQMVRDVAAHEFFHIVTPLNIHSEEIHDFDYIDPDMSQHLWLYEGVTEYSAMHVQVKYGLYDRETFLNQIKEKLVMAGEFPADVSFTEMSDHILEEEYNLMFENVYYKGALIAMCLDLYLLKYSNGEKDLQWLMRLLSKEYGKDKPFKDEELFDIIEVLTFPEVGEYFKKHVEGSEPLPIKEVLAWAGIEYAPVHLVQINSLGGISLGLTKDQELYILDDFKLNDFGKAMGFQADDVLLSLNGREITLVNSREIFEDYFQNFPTGDTVQMVVRRKVKGKNLELTLSAPSRQEELLQQHWLSSIEEASEEQLRIREAWLEVQMK